jgi:hypothetical protein
LALYAVVVTTGIAARWRFAMFVRSLFGAVLAVFALVAVVAPVGAGGWAITVLDKLPGEFRAGETYHLGYRILQHGVDPFPGAETGISMVNTATAATLFFPGRPEGAAGHYVADVRVPTAGEWRWTVEQGPFEPQELGILRVLPTTASVSPTADPTVAPTVARLATAVPVQQTVHESDVQPAAEPGVAAAFRATESAEGAAPATGAIPQTTGLTLAIVAALALLVLGGLVAWRTSSARHRAQASH